jgi:pyridoxal 5'-phosphate synthase pdxT subunit
MIPQLKVGVLALQGDFSCHLNHLRLLGAQFCEVRQSYQLSELDGLIIPGGESTTMSMLIDRFDLRKPLADFAGQKAVWGTCAGMIMLAKEIDDSRVNPFGVIDISVQRNAYGRQAHSFFAPVMANLNGRNLTLQASFIRAPRVSRIGPDIKVLAEYDKIPVLMSQKNCLASSFHTELGEEPSLTKFFLENFVSVYK